MAILLSFNPFFSGFRHWMEIWCRCLQRLFSLTEKSSSEFLSIQWLHSWHYCLDTILWLCDFKAIPCIFPHFLRHTKMKWEISIWIPNTVVIWKFLHWSWKQQKSMLLIEKITRFFSNLAEEKFPSGMWISSVSHAPTENVLMFSNIQIQVSKMSDQASIIEYWAVQVYASYVFWIYLFQNYFDLNSFLTFNENMIFLYFKSVSISHIQSSLFKKPYLPLKKWSFILRILAFAQTDGVGVVK